VCKGRLLNLVESVNGVATAAGVSRWPFTVREKCEVGYTPAVFVKSEEAVEK